MFTKPSIHALVAVDQNWNICFGGDNTSVLDHPSIHPDVKKLDRALLRKTLRESYTLFVVGENTAKQMGRLLETLPVLVSTKDTTNLATHAMKIALEKDLHNICVLGGRSVYNAFIHQYDSIFVHQLKLSEDIEGKKVFNNYHEHPMTWINKIFDGGELGNKIFEMVLHDE
jgi:dihydrofolate reductase